MKNIIALTVLTLMLSFCSGQTQLDINQEQQEKYLAVDKELNVTYQKILVEYKKDTAFIKNLKISQKLWMQFRDAEMKMKYPDREEGYYGSIHNLCWGRYETVLTQERVKKLKEWLIGSEQGDPCSGSLKVND